MFDVRKFRLHSTLRRRRDLGLAAPRRALRPVRCAKVSQSITIDSPWAACAGECSVCTSNWTVPPGGVTLVRLLHEHRIKAPPTASTTSHDPPRDTLNDDDEFTTPSPRTFALRLAAATRADLRRVARCELPSLANSHARVRGRVLFSWPSDRVRTGAPSRDNSTRKKKVQVDSQSSFFPLMQAIVRLFSTGPRVYRLDRGKGT